MVSLDAVGNTTKAITKGVAIGSAVIAAVALFAAFIQTIGEQLNIHATREPIVPAGRHRDKRRQPQDVHRHADRGVDSVPGLVVPHPCRRPLRRHRGRRGAQAVPGTPRHHGPTPSGPSTAVSWTSARKASLRELATPALLAVLMPVVVGFGIGYLALGPSWPPPS